MQRYFLLSQFSQVFVCPSGFYVIVRNLSQCQVTEEFTYIFFRTCMVSFFTFRSVTYLEHIFGYVVIGNLICSLFQVAILLPQYHLLKHSPFPLWFEMASLSFTKFAYIYICVCMSLYGFCFTGLSIHVSVQYCIIYRGFKCLNIWQD